MRSRSVRQALLRERIDNRMLVPMRTLPLCLLLCLSTACGGADPPDRTHRQRAVGQARPERTAVKFIERVGAHAHRKKERDKSPEGPRVVDARCGRRTEQDVGQMPRRIRRVEQRHHVPPAAWAQRVKRRASVSGQRTASPT